MRVEEDNIDDILPKSQRLPVFKAMLKWVLASLNKFNLVEYYPVEQILSGQEKVLRAYCLNKIGVIVDFRHLVYMGTNRVENLVQIRIDNTATTEQYNAIVQLMKFYRPAGVYFIYMRDALGGTNPTLSLSQTSINALESASTVTINVTSSTAFTVSETLDWVTISNITSTSFRVNIQANTSLQRSGVITVSNSNTTINIAIGQAGQSEYIHISTGNSLSFSHLGETLGGTVDANVSWTISTNATWLTVSKSGSSFSVTAPQNTNQTSRYDNVTISGAGGTVTQQIWVYQSAAQGAVISATNVARNIAKLTSYTQKPPFDQMRVMLPYHEQHGVSQPKWVIIGQLGHDLWDANNWPNQNGFAASPDFTRFMTRGRDFIYPTNPDTASDPWPNEIDPATVAYYPPSGKSISQFVGVGYSYRAVNFINDDTDYGSLLNFYNAGRSNALLEHFGRGDYDAGKSRGLFIAFDKEIGTTTEGKQKKLALMIGAAEATTAYVSELYTPVFATYSGSLNIDHTRKYKNYPDDSGNYASDAELFGVYDANFKISISEKGVTNKSALDYPNIVPCEELAFHHIEFAKHNSLYDLGNGHQVTIRKFGQVWNDSPNGAGFNVQSAYVNYMTNSECFAYYCINKLGRRGFFQGKMLCDKDGGQFAGGAGFVTANDGQMVADTIISRDNMPVSREYAFLWHLIDYMNGNHKYDWMIAGNNDGAYYNPARTFDGVIGANAAIKMLHQQGKINEFHEMTPLLWNSEYSLDGTNWKKTKGVDLNMSTTDVLGVRIKVGTGTAVHIMEVAAYRPEGIEPLEFWARATVNGALRTVHVTPAMWSTVNPSYPDGSTIPDSEKLYFYAPYEF